MSVSAAHGIFDESETTPVLPCVFVSIRITTISVPFSGCAGRHGKHGHASIFVRHYFMMKRNIRKMPYPRDPIENISRTVAENTSELQICPK